MTTGRTPLALAASRNRELMSVARIVMFQSAQSGIVRRREDGDRVRLFPGATGGSAPRSAVADRRFDERGPGRAGICDAKRVSDSVVSRKKYVSPTVR